MRKPDRWIAVFGSARPPQGSEDYALARRVGRLLAEAGFGVLNGGYGGTMEASARGAREAGGRVAGVTVSVFGGAGNRWLDETIQTRTLFERLENLLLRADGFIGLKGGTGTLAEIALAWEYNNKELWPDRRARPLVLMGGFWGPIADLMACEDTRYATQDPNRSTFLAATAEEAVAILSKRLPAPL